MKQLLVILALITGGVAESQDLDKAQKHNPAVVKINLLYGGSGTGFKVRLNDLNFILTASHVCGLGNHVNINGKNYPVYARAPEVDLCIIKNVEGGGPQTSLKFQTTKVRMKSKVYKLGYGGDRMFMSFKYKKEGVLQKHYLFTIMSEKVTRPNHPINCGVYNERNYICNFRTYLIKPDIFVGGDSGGPVLNSATGKVIGMTMAHDPRLDECYAIPAESIIKALEARLLFL